MKTATPLRDEEKSALARTFETLMRQLAPELTITGEEVYVFGDAGYRFDYVVEGWIGVEVDGGVHRIDDNFRRDMNKHNFAVAHGWTFLRFGRHMVDDPFPFFDALKYMAKCPSPCRKGGDAQ